MTLTEGGFLLDVNVLLALTDELHVHHGAVTTWFDDGGGRAWASCAMTECGFIRLKASPKIGGHSVLEAIEVLRLLVGHRGHRFWPMASDWCTLTAGFQERIFGHKQVTDACLLGTAVKEDGVLVTLDRGFRYLAGTQYSKNLLVLE